MSLRCVMLGIAFLVSGAFSVDQLDGQTCEKPVKKGKLFRVTYPVADLVVPIVDQSAFDDRKAEKAIPNHDELVRVLTHLVTSTVAKNSWENAGGGGSIQYFPVGMALVVNQTEEVHQEIAQLLADLRRLQEVQVAVSVHLIEVTPATAERLLSVMKKHGQPVAERSVAIEEKRLLSMLELVQADRLGTIRQTPRLTLSNGQKAAFKAMSEKIGVRFDVTTVVSADRKTVRLSLDLENVLTTTRALRSGETFNVPSDRTLVWHVGEVGGTHVFVAATPRVTMAEEEKLFMGTIAPIPGR